jgi:hypothetical protein
MRASRIDFAQERHVRSSGNLHRSPEARKTGADDHDIMREFHDLPFGYYKKIRNTLAF